MADFLRGENQGENGFGRAVLWVQCAVLRFSPFEKFAYPLISRPVAGPPDSADPLTKKSRILSFQHFFDLQFAGNELTYNPDLCVDAWEGGL